MCKKEKMIQKQPMDPKEPARSCISATKGLIFSLLMVSQPPESREPSEGSNGIEVTGE